MDGASYNYDSACNRTSKTNYLNGTTENFGYDALYALTQVTQGASTTESYSYDAVGNRLSSAAMSSYQYNSSNELTSNSSGSYTYDANGNTLADPSGKSYSWDFENRLTQVVNPGVGTTTFKYDPFGRRVYKSSPTWTGAFVYEGRNLIETMNSSGAEVADYTQGPSLDEPLSELRGSTVSFYQVDFLGSITSLTNPAGRTSQHLHIRFLRQPHELYGCAQQSLPIYRPRVRPGNWNLQLPFPLLRPDPWEVPQRGSNPLGRWH